MDYIDRLTAMRIDHDLTQETVAQIINKSQQGYNHIEKRRVKLSVEDFMTLCEFYNLSPEYFLGYTKEMKPLK
ncbi:MAG: helix-turn-helix transcriptional regulator [Clostridia bacterium]|nr:helix-turn-helix transcriptional regulator [Clostridia bacterium]